jgi:predicted nucleic acid-binding protein
MIFADIPPGAAFFLDANPLIYYFTADPTFGPACAQLLRRIELQDVQAFTSAHVLGEVVHALMTFEARQRFGWPATGITRRLKRHPAQVQLLDRYRQALDEIHLLGIIRLPVTGVLVSLAGDVTRRFGLLQHDSLVVAMMEYHALTHLASNDPDFDRVPGISRYAPS